MRAIVILLLASPAAADEWLTYPDPAAGAVETGASTELAREPPSRWGLEIGLADDGEYARGIALDVEERWEESAQAYGDAAAEQGGLASLTGVPDECRAGWSAKASWQETESERLLEQQAYVAIMPQSALAHYALGDAYHSKFRSIRAFLGRAPRTIWQHAEDEYLAALELDPQHVAARLGLAALYAEAGQAGDAAVELARVGRRKDDEQVSHLVAAYLAAADEPDEALTYLESAMERTEHRRWALRSNAFDGLRGTERYWELVTSDVAGIGSGYADLCH